MTIYVITSITAPAMHLLNHPGGGYIEDLETCENGRKRYSSWEQLHRNHTIARGALGLEVIVFSRFSWHNQDKYQAHSLEGLLRGGLSRLLAALLVLVYEPCTMAQNCGAQPSSLTRALLNPKASHQQCLDRFAFWDLKDSLLSLLGL